MDKETYSKLELLAAQSRRSRSSVLRALICLAVGDQVRELRLPGDAESTQQDRKEKNSEEA